jgi:HSP20 family protein
MTHERTRRTNLAGPPDHSHRAGLGAFNEIFLSSSKLVMIQAERSWQPPTDVYETENEVIIKSEIAGIKPEEVMIAIESDHISIRGVRYEKATAHIPGKRNFRQMEINYGKFERIIRLDGHINPENAQAHYKDGFLEIIIPKSKQKRVIASIEIHFS